MFEPPCIPFHPLVFVHLSAPNLWPLCLCCPKLWCGCHAPELRPLVASLSASSSGFCLLTKAPVTTMVSFSFQPGILAAAVVPLRGLLLSWLMSLLSPALSTPQPVSPPLPPGQHLGACCTLDPAGPLGRMRDCFQSCCIVIGQ